jgi:hypothetical protein
MNWNSVVGVSTRLQVAWPMDSHSNPAGAITFSVLRNSDRFWSPNSTLIENQVPVQRKKICQGVKLSFHLQLELTFRISGAILPLLHTYAWHTHTHTHTHREHCTFCISYLIPTRNKLGDKCEVLKKCLIFLRFWFYFSARVPDITRRRFVVLLGQSTQISEQNFKAV